MFFLIVCLLADLLEGVEVNPERPSKKQSEHHMPSFGKNKQAALRFSFPLPFVDDFVSFQSVYCPFNFVYLRVLLFKREGLVREENIENKEELGDQLTSGFRGSSPFR